jgi:hypothetical protein
MRKNTLYLHESDFGVGLIAAQSIQQARAEAIRDCGTSFFRGVRKATAEDVAWIRTMGGRVPR